MQSVAILVEDSNVGVRVERVRSDHHDSSVNVVQVLDGRLGDPEGWECETPMIRKPIGSM